MELIVAQCIQALRFTTTSKVCVMQTVLDIHADTSIVTEEHNGSFLIWNHINSKEQHETVPSNIYDAPSLTIMPQKSQAHNLIA